MSLLVWYPLNGDYYNRGILGSALDPTPNSLVYTDGKLGKSLQTGSLSWTAEQTAMAFHRTTTIAFWIKPTQTGSGCIIGNSDMTNGGRRKYTFYQWQTYDSLHYTWQHDDSGSAFFGGTTPLTPGVWNHVVAIQDEEGGYCSIYINGERKVHSAQNIKSMNFNYSWPTTIIQNTAINNICDFRVYDHVLTEKEIRALSSGMLIHYNFEDGVGSTIYDCSGYENHAINTGVIEKTDTNLGKHSAYFASSGSQYLTIPNPPLDNKNISISMWWKSSNTAAKGGYHILFATSYSSSISCVELSIPSAGQLRWGFVIGGTRTTDNTTISPQLNNGQWRHIAMTYDGTIEKAYVDGVLVGSRTKSGTISYPTIKDTFIGKYVGGSYGATDAYISDVKVFNTTLTSTEVESLYRHTVKITPAQHILASQLVEDGSQEYIDFLAGPYTSGGWGGNTTTEGNEFVLTATNGWHSFVWKTPEACKGKNAVLSFEYCFTNKEGWSDGVWVHTTPSNAQYLIGTGPKVYDTALNTWTSISLPLTNLTDYIGWTLRGADGKGKHIVMRIRNARLLTDIVTPKIHPSGVVNGNGFNQIEKVRIENHGLITASDFVEV